MFKITGKRKAKRVIDNRREEEIVGQYHWNNKEKRLTRYQSLDGRWLSIPEHIVKEMLVNLEASEYRVVDRLKDMQFTILRKELEKYGKYEEDPVSKEMFLWVDLSNFRQDDWSKSDTYLRLRP